jgi:chemotaxis protein MotB
MGKRAAHGGHGGAWKVAYADFVTSMMCLFMVLWLVGSDEETKTAVQRYFKGELQQQGRRGNKEYSQFKPYMNEVVDKASKDLLAIQEMTKAMERLREQLKNSSEIGDDQIRFEFHADGVRIVAIDKSKRPFFDPGTAELTDFGKFILSTIAIVLERYPYTIEIEGHTQKPSIELAKNQPVNLWNLSSDRALAAQNLLMDGGIDTQRFFRVIGYADRQPMENTPVDSEDNRRITIIIRPANTDTVEIIRDQVAAP